MSEIIQSQADKNKHSYVGKKGDLRVELHFCDVNDGHGRQACLYLHKFNDYPNGVLVPFADMWQYAERNAIDKVVRPIALKLYGIQTKSDEFRVMDAIFDYLEDLKNHKPEPDQDKTLDQFLQECDDEELEFFIEDGSGRRMSLN